MRTRMRMIVPVASVALLTATAGAAAATASSTSPTASPSASKSSGGAGEPSKVPPSGGCGGGGGVTKSPAPQPGTPDPKEIQVLAGIMHVSQSKAEQVLERIDRIAAQDDGISPTDPKFITLAQSLHLTAQQLSDDLVQMKQDLAKLTPKPSDSAKPAPSSGQS